MLVRWSPFREFNTLQNEVNRIFNDYGRASAAVAPEGSSSWHPAVDIYEDEGSFVLNAELPGLGKDDVHLNLENRTLTLSGERKMEKDVQEESYHRIERFYGRFSRSFTLPSGVNVGGIQATFQDGVLNVVLPKAEEVKPKRIEIL